ncbi:MAG: glycosyltransferase family 2 protein [Clostridiaceae bacterium]
MDKPYFSIVIPVYNIERLIDKTLSSVLLQTHQDWEAICIDDGSPDKAGLICDNYAQKDSRIKVVHKKNEGLAAARNTGIKNSNGQYIIILEGSDLFASDKTLQFIRKLIGDNSPDIVFGRLQDLLEKKWSITNVQKKYCVDGIFTEGGEKLLIKLLENEDILAYSSPVNKIYKRSFIIKNNLWFCEGIYHDDDEWVPKAIAHTKTTLFTNEIIYSALDWAECFGNIKNEKGLTKKACDKMFLAERCCEYFSTHFSGNNELLAKVYEYYIRFYQSGMCGFFEVNDSQFRIKVLESIRKHSGILKYAKYTESINLNILSLIYRTLGARATLFVLNKRIKRME